MFKKIIKNPRSRDNFKLVDGDRILIGSKPDLVVIEGEVNSPGNYKYHSGNSVRDYIKLSGGFTKDASRFSIFIVFPDGTTKKIKPLKLSPVVSDGSKIVVGRKEDVDPFSPTEFVATYTEFLTDLTQAWLMITLATR